MTTFAVYAAAAFFIGGATGAAAADYKTIACPFVTSSNVVCGEVLITPHRVLPVVRLGGGGAKIPAVILGGGGPGAGLFLHEAQGVVFWDKFRREILGDAGELILIDQSGTGILNRCCLVPILPSKPCLPGRCRLRRILILLSRNTSVV
ncbi:MAG: hypothetical protein R1F54_05955 [Candidatus Zeuxoniibacter abyssi]|nr:MAG: hypothetical protein R1F54_05955 [Candidatus Persebacteraceae bacterium AB1(2)]